MSRHSDSCCACGKWRLIKKIHPISSISGDNHFALDKKLHHSVLTWLPFYKQPCLRGPFGFCDFTSRNSKVPPKWMNDICIYLYMQSRLSVTDVNTYFPYGQVLKQKHIKKKKSNHLCTIFFVVVKNIWLFFFSFPKTQIITLSPPPIHIQKKTPHVTKFIL